MKLFNKVIPYSLDEIERYKVLSETSSQTEAVVAREIYNFMLDANAVWLKGK